jgi:hypothetical protein
LAALTISHCCLNKLFTILKLLKRPPNLQNTFIEKELMSNFVDSCHLREFSLPMRPRETLAFDSFWDITFHFLLDTVALDYEIWIKIKRKKRKSHSPSKAKDSLNQSLKNLMLIIAHIKSSIWKAKRTRAHTQIVNIQRL